jgi:lipopolysaccharide assembly protein A
MRFLCFLFLVLFAAAVGGFAYYNQEPVTVRFWDYSVTSSLAVVVGGVYVLGMVSGWTMIRMVRRSASSVIDSAEREMARRR